MLVPMYLSFLIPLVFLIISVKGEGRGLVLSFAWGLSSTVIMYFSSAIYNWLGVADDIQLQYLIPASEELIKMLPLFFLYFTKRKLGTAHTIARCAIAMGIGFSIMENYFYISTMEGTSSSSTIVFAIMRSLTTALLHGSTTALLGYGFQIMKIRKFFSMFIVITLWIGAACTHSLYNSLWASQTYGVLAILIPLSLFLFSLFGINSFGIVFAGGKYVKSGSN